MKTISVQLDKRSYPIYLGQGLLKNASPLSSHIKGSQVLIVTQPPIAHYYLESLRASIPSHIKQDVMMLAVGEQQKTLTEWQRIIDHLMEHGHERSTTLIALGGGMVGDMTGFAAACYQRGVHYIQIPTTLIAQVDSSVGGKTGVNHPLGKNMIGAFYQPECVVIDIETLQSLPEREYISGLAEIIKYGLIRDFEFFCWLEDNVELLLKRNAEALLYAIERSVTIKAEIVHQDEHDQGVRHLLNFGHTFGHALEVACHYTDILHGEAVAVGMLMASSLSKAQGFISTEEFVRVKQLLKKAGLLQKMFPVSFLEPFLMSDKKVRDGKLTFILLKRVGEGIRWSAE